MMVDMAHTRLTIKAIKLHDTSAPHVSCEHTSKSGAMNAKKIAKTIEVTMKMDEITICTNNDLILFFTASVSVLLN